MIESKFLFDTSLVGELENIIKNAKHTLLIISPFIDLDRRIQDALLEKVNKHDLKIKVLFGKNEDNIYKSIKKDSLDFLKQFPNIEIRYNDRLHAKFYSNDFDCILTSMNLYDFSLAKNIEVGVLFNHTPRGILTKVLEGTNNMLNQGVDKVKQNVLGLGQDSVDPIEKFNIIFSASELKFETSPIIEDESGFKGIIGGKKLGGFNVIVDNLKPISKEYVPQNIEHKTQDSTSNASITRSEQQDVNQSKLQSASQLSRTIGVPQSDIINVMQKAGFIDGDKITSMGLSKGLVMKNYMGKNYIAYPDNLPEFNKLKN